jgi:DNA-binding transcriptional MocR family regulator
MSQERRACLAAAAKKYDFIIIENDILGMMPAQQITTLYSFAPERTCYITGLTKVVAAGFRLAFIVSSSALLDRLTTAVHGTTWMPPPLMS